MVAESPAVSNRPRRIFGLHPNVFFLGLTSLLNDFSSEMIFTLLPLFLTNILGASAVVVGLVGGMSGSADAILRVFSGWYSDKVGNRKNFAVLGYAVSAMTKPFMYIATTWAGVVVIRFVDRLGKGTRNAPRDALLADSVTREQRGKAFGLQRAMDTSGAVFGLSATALIVFLLQGNAGVLELSTFRWMVIVGAVPGFIGTLVIFLLVHEARKKPKQGAAGKSELKVTGGFSRRFKIYLVILAIFTLGNSSDFFVILRAQNLGNSLFDVALILVAFNVVYAAVAIPAGALSDRLGRRGIMTAGWLVYAGVFLGFAVASVAWQVWVLFAAYGLYYALAEGVSRAFVVDLVPAEKRGTAFGWYYGVLSLALLPASLIAGWLWEAVNPAAMFYFGAGLAFIAAMAIWFVLPNQRQSNP